MAVKDVLVDIRLERSGGFSLRRPDVPCVVVARGSDAISRLTPRAVSLHPSHHRRAAQNVPQTFGVGLSRTAVIAAEIWPFPGVEGAKRETPHGKVATSAECQRAIKFFWSSSRSRNKELVGLHCLVFWR